MKLLILTIFVLFFASCSQAQNVSSALTFPELISGIQTRSEGLVFISETDSDVVVWYRNRTVDSLSEAEFKRVAKIPPLATVEIVPFDQLFTRLVDLDKTGQWLILRDYLESNLQDYKVFRVPRPAPYERTFDVYAVGLFENKVIGIHVVSLET